MVHYPTPIRIIPFLLLWITAACGSETGNPSESGAPGGNEPGSNTSHYDNGGGGSSTQTTAFNQDAGSTAGSAGNDAGVGSWNAGAPSDNDEELGIGLKAGGAQDIGYFRKLVASGLVPHWDDMTIEGWLNEHDTELPAAEPDRLVTLHAMLGLHRPPGESKADCVLQLGMNSAVSLNELSKKPLNLAVVVDTSGSMNDAGKMEFVKLGLKRLLDELSEADRFALVKFDTDATVVFPSAHLTLAKKQELLSAINNLTPDGWTNLYDGLLAGYKEVEKSQAAGQIPRVMLVSDGLPTAGIEDAGLIVNMSKKFNAKGIGLTTIGLGVTSDQKLMASLAQTAGGNYYFLQDESKVQDVFVEELAYLLTPVASNLQIQFKLTNGFELRELYGFEWAQDEAGMIHILGPKTNDTDVAPEVPPEDPNDPQPPEDPKNTEGVAIPTLFASKKPGLLMMRLDGPAEYETLSQLTDAIAEFGYAYDTEDDQGNLVSHQFTTTVTPPLTALEDLDGSLFYFQNPIVRRGFTILQLGLALQNSTALFHGTDIVPQDGSEAAKTLQDAVDFGHYQINTFFPNDESLAADVAFLEELLLLIQSAAE
ncbi:MAG: VWA domain-containing protein [Myxococcales bacterium]|nr:VWA domain-containing protein [Myxococcales bacterium]